MGNRRKYLRVLMALALVLLLAASVVGGLIWWERIHAEPPQEITLPTGERYRFAGVTYGTNAVPPSWQVRLANLLPARLAKMARLQPYTNTALPFFYFYRQPEGPQLSVWFKRMSTNAPFRSAFNGRLADENGVEAGAQNSGFFGANPTWIHLDFAVLPRRSRTLECNLYQNQARASGTTPPPMKKIGSVRFVNPVYEKYPQWQPEPVHVEKKAGEIGVTIDDLWEELQEQLQIKNTKMDLSLHFPDPIKSEWVMHEVVLSDATGNSLRSAGINRLFNGRRYGWPGQSQSTVQGTLWPGEAAWRVKVELKRSAGFGEGELAVFKRIPVASPGTNQVRLTNMVGGIELVLTETTMAVSYSNPPGGPSGRSSGYEYQIQLEIPGKPAGMAVDLLSADTDEGTVNPMMSFSDDGYAYEAILMDRDSSAQATNMNLTFAVQKTRSVEFLVKPPKE